MLCDAAFVADIYGVNQTQGPALNSSQSSALSGMYGMNPELLLDRVGAGVAEVMLQHPVLSDNVISNHLPAEDAPLSSHFCWLLAVLALLVPFCMRTAHLLVVMQQCVKFLCVFTQAQMQSMVLPNATVVIGYCFGGSAVLDLAASWPSMTDGVQGKPCKAFH